MTEHCQLGLTVPNLDQCHSAWGFPIYIHELELSSILLRSDMRMKRRVFERLG